jgi:hypothetical protein
MFVLIHDVGVRCMPFFTEDDQQYFRQMVGVLFDKGKLSNPKDELSEWLPSLSAQIGTGNAKKLRDIVACYAETKGTVEEFKKFEARLDQALGEIKRDAGESSLIWMTLDTRKFREHVIALVFNMTTDTLIDLAERAAQENGMTILPDEVKKIMLCFDTEKNTKDNFEGLKENLNQYLKEGITYNKEKLDPSASKLERCFLKMKQLVRKLLQFVAGIFSCYKPSWDTLNSMFVSMPETEASKAFRTSMEPLNEHLQAHATACVSVAP